MKRGIAASMTLAASLLAGTALSSTAIAETLQTLEVESVVGHAVTVRMQLPRDARLGIEDSPVTSVRLGGSVLPSTSSLVVPTSTTSVAALVIDSSGSLTVSQRDRIRIAVNDFGAALPRATRVGIINVSDTADIALEPTTSRAALNSAMRTLPNGGDTPLFDGVELSRAMVAEGGSGRVIVLSDGADNASTRSLADLTAALVRSRTPVDVVAFGANTTGMRVLRSLTSQGGRLIPAGSDLSSAFASASGGFTPYLSVDFEAPASNDSRGELVEVTSRIAGTVYSGSTVLPQSSSLAAEDMQAAAINDSGVTAANAPDAGGALAVAGLVALAVLGIFLIAQLFRQRRGRVTRLQQLQAYVRPTPDDPTRHSLIAQALAWLNGELLAIPATSRTSRRLAAAGVTMTPAGWLLTRVALTLGFFAVSLLLFRSMIIALLAAGFALALPSLIIARRTRKAREAFADELPSFLLLLASALRAGLAFGQALESAAHERDSAVSSEVRRALREIQVGAHLEDALLDIADRMDNQDLRWTVTALNIQREVGGNLSMILDTAAQTMKSREEIRREVRSLSAEGRLSAYVLVALPLGVFAFLFIFRREYISNLWTTTIGLLLLGIFAFLLISGWLWMRALVRIKV